MLMHTALLMMFVTMSMHATMSFADGFAQPQGRAYVAQNGHAPRMDYDVTPYIGTMGGGGASTGVLAAYRLTPNGFISVLNNSVSIEGGVNAGMSCPDSHCDGVFTLSGHLRWEFHVHPQWSVYASPGLALGQLKWLGDSDTRKGLFPAPKVGAFWRISETRIIRFEYDLDFDSHRIGYTFVL